MILVRAARLSLRILARNRIRTALAVLGIAVAVFLLCAERALHAGVREATESNERETRLIVYRANRFCPFTSRMPERYVDDIVRIPGVRSAVPMQIVVSNCRASLDVVVFRGVRAADARSALAPRLRTENVFAIIRISAEEKPRFLPPRDGAYLTDRFRRSLGFTND